MGRTETATPTPYRETHDALAEARAELEAAELDDAETALTEREENQQ